MKFDDEAREAMRSGLLKDMSDHQRGRGKVPTASDNETLMVPIFERIEQRQRERDGRPKPKLTPAEPTRRTEAKAKAAGWKITRDEDERTDKIRTLDGISAEVFNRLYPRVQLLLSKHEHEILGRPSWRERILAVIAKKWRGHPAQEYVAELIQICEESNELFGDWKKDVAAPIFFDVGRNAQN